jgi:hypothetical protein
MNDPIRPFVYRIKRALREDAGEYAHGQVQVTLLEWKHYEYRYVVDHQVEFDTQEIKIKFYWWWHHGCEISETADQWKATLWLNGHEVYLSPKEQCKLMTAGESALARKAQRRRDEFKAEQAAIQLEIDALIAKLESTDA